MASLQIEAERILTRQYTLKKAIQFYLRAVTRYQVHAPFAAQVIAEVCRNKKQYYGLNDIENLRGIYLSSNKEFSLTDFGAGSKRNKNKKSLGEITALAASGPQKGKILFHLSRYFKPNKIVELGTNIGLGTSYLALGNRNSSVTTYEGDPALIEQANETFSYLKIDNVKIIEGAFDLTLRDSLSSMNQIDLAFLDGNHRYEATLEYYNLMAPHIGTNSIIIVDDIYWSAGMTKAWDELKNDPAVSLSIDLFQVGILFFEPKIQKEHIRLIPTRWKPWKNGLFG